MTRPATQRIAAAAAAVATRPQDSFGPRCGTRRGLRGKQVRPTSSSSPSGPMPIKSAESLRSGSITSSSLRSRRGGSHPAGKQRQSCPGRIRALWHSHAIWQRCAAPKLPRICPLLKPGLRSAYWFLAGLFSQHPSLYPCALRCSCEMLNLGNLFQTRSGMHACRSPGMCRKQEAERRHEHATMT